jgi:hypothetical protein
MLQPNLFPALASQPMLPQLSPLPQLPRCCFHSILALSATAPTHPILTTTPNLINHPTLRYSQAPADYALAAPPPTTAFARVNVRTDNALAFSMS